MPVSRIDAATPTQGGSAAGQTTDGKVQAWQAAAASPPPAPSSAPPKAGDQGGTGTPAPGKTQVPESLLSDNPGQDPANCLSAAATTAKNGQDNIVFLKDNSPSASGVGHAVVQNKTTGEVTDPENLSGKHTTADLSTYINQAKAGGHDFAVATTASAGDVQQVLSLPQNQRAGWIAQNAPQISGVAASLYADSSTPNNAPTPAQPSLSLQEFADLVEHGTKPQHASVDTSWDTPGNYPATDNNYSNVPRYIGLGQYGKGLADDFAANYGGVNDQQRQAILQDPGNVSSHIAFTGPVDPNQVIKPVVGNDENQTVDGSIAGSVGTYTYLAGSSTFSTAALTASYKAYENQLSSKLPKISDAWAKFASNALGNLGSSLYLAGSIANVFATHSVNVGAAVNNSEDALAFTNNVALFGANAEGGQHVMDVQTDAMNKAADSLSQDSNGNFKDPEYAMRTVNQMMKLSGQDPAFISQNSASLPEVTTANGQTDNVLPADIFALGGASSNSKDLSSALSNQPDTNAATFSDIDQRRKNDALDVTNVSQNWINNANKYANEGDYSNATGRQTGMTRMVNDFDGQLQKTGDSLSNYNAAELKLSGAVGNVMKATNFDTLARQAGDAITKNYAAEEGVDPKDVQPVSIGINEPQTINNRATAGWNTFFGLDQNARKIMNDTYGVAPNSNLWQIQQQLHSSLMASGSQLTPFTQIAQNVANDVFSNMDNLGKPGANQANYDSAKTKFVSDIRANPGLFPALNGGGYDQIANNIFKSGLSTNISFDAIPTNTSSNVPGGNNPTSNHGMGSLSQPDTRKDMPGQSINVTLQTDNLQDHPDAVFDQIWNAVSNAVKAYPVSGSSQGWAFGNIALNGAVPLGSDNSIAANPDGTADHWQIGNAPVTVEPGGNATGS